MTVFRPPDRGRLFADLTAPGRSSFDWAVLLAALALLIPVSGLASVLFAERSRRRGYPRWKAAMAIGIWCLVLGVSLRAVMHVGVLP
jgi:hypothetical protein